MSVEKPINARWGKENFPTLGKFLILGEFGPKDIIIEMSQRRFSPPANLVLKIEERWIPRAANGEEDEPRVRLDSYNLTSDGKLHLVLGETTFKEFIGTRPAEFLQAYGWEIANPLSVSVALLTKDRKLLAILEDRNRIDVPGGYLDPTRDFDLDTGVPNLFQAAKSRLIDETEIRDEEISKTVCLGLSYEYNGSRDEKSHPVLSFAMKTKLIAEEILRRQKKDKLNKVMVVEVFKGKTNKYPYAFDLLREQYPMVEPDGRITIALVREWLLGRKFKPQVLRTTEEIQQINKFSK